MTRVKGEDSALKEEDEEEVEEEVTSEIAKKSRERFAINKSYSIEVSPPPPYPPCYSTSRSR